MWFYGRTLLGPSVLVPLLFLTAISADASDDGQRNLYLRRTAERQTFIAGQFHPLGIVALQGLADDLYREGRVRVRPADWTCGDVGSSLMDSAVQPPCVGNVCNGPMARNGDMASWDSVRIIRVGVFSLCWCRPSYACQTARNCCQEDSSYSDWMGEVEVAGPAWISVSPVLGQGFRFELEGPEVLAGSHALLRLRDTGGACGFVPFRDDEEKSSFSLLEAKEEHEILILSTPPNQGATLNISGVMGSQMLVAYLYRHLVYSICWCARNCFKDGVSEIDEEAFSANVGEFFPRGPDTEGFTPQYVVAGVSFDLMVQGDRLTMKDRILVPDSSISCGDVATAHALAFRSHLCGRGDSACIATPGNGPPTGLQNMGELVGESGISFVQTVWSPVQIDTPGTYRICWCVDDSWDPVKLESYGLCGSGFQFNVQAGLVVVQGSDGDQRFQCTSFQPCNLNIISELPFESGDRIMVVAPPPTSTNSLATVCGRGTTGLQVEVGAFHSIYDTTTTSPPLFTSTLGVNETTTTVVAQPSHYVGEFLLESAGQAGLYRLCYCKNAELGPCDDPVAFAQFAGILNISGKVEYEPSRGIHQQCLVSQRCHFNITGVWAMQLSFLDSFRAVPTDIACDDEADSSSYPYFTLQRRLELSDTWRSEFSHKAGAESLYFTGDYKLCYCQASLTPSRECTPEQHTQEMGTLYLVGAKSRMEWTCRQGAPCELVVHGWRVALGDAIRLVYTGFNCGDIDYGDAFLGTGFDANPSVANQSSNLSDGVLLHFDLGRARGSGRWKVCLCVASTARSGNGCSQSSDYGQKVGELLIEGLLRSVTPSSQPSTLAMASVLVDVIEPGNAWGVACAASNQSFEQAPSSQSLLTCHQSMPGCLGITRLPWRAEQGYNILHVPLTVASGIELQEAHVWCTGDLNLCPTGRCVLPPTGTGLTMALRVGPDPWTEYHAAIGEPLELQVNGNPLNTEGGWLKIVWPSDGCPEAEQSWEIQSPFSLGRPLSASPQRWLRYSMAKVPMAGRFWLCWCDRSYGASCALWQHIGVLLLAGPVNVTGVPEMLELLEVFNVTLNGVNLTLEEQLYIAESTCDKPSSFALSPRRLNDGAVSANFELQAPAVAGSFVVCWTRVGQIPQKMGEGFARESRDCILAGWELAAPSIDYQHLTSDGQACSRSCGGGLYEMRRNVIAQAVGGGIKCPGAASPERSRFFSCNTQPCPTALALNVYTEPKWVKPNTFFQVIVEGYFLKPEEDRVVLVQGGDAVECGQAANSSGGNASENGSIPQVQWGSGATCSQPASNSTYLQCGDGVASLVVNQPGRYRLCLCHAASVQVEYVNISGSMELLRDRCSRLEDFALMPSNGSLIDITGSHTETEEKADVDDALGVLGMKGLQESGRNRSDLILILGLISATLLYCCAILGACWFWRYRWRKRGEWRRMGSGLFKNSLVAKATKAAWEAYNRTVTEQAQLTEDGDGENVDDLVAEPLADLTSVPQTGTLTPPGTGVSLKSGSSMHSSSTSSTRATTPGNHPSLLKVALNRDVHRPVSPKMGGSFLDLPLAGKGTRSATASPSRPCTANTVLTIAEEPGSEVKQETPRDAASDHGSGGATPTATQASRMLELQLPGLEKKLAKLREEQSESETESPQSEALPAPRGVLAAAPPSMAPPSLPGQPQSEAAKAEASKSSPRPSEVPQAPSKPSLPSMSAMRRPLPPPPKLSKEAEVPEPIQEQSQSLQPATPVAVPAPVLEESQEAGTPHHEMLPEEEEPPAVEPDAPRTPQTPQEETPEVKAPQEPEQVPSTPSTPASKMSKDESPSGAPKLSSWLTDMRSRMANKQAAESKEVQEKPEKPAASTSKFAPSSSLRPSGKLTKPPKPPPKPSAAASPPAAAETAAPTEIEVAPAVPPLALPTVEEEPTAGIVRCFRGNASGISSKASAGEQSTQSTAEQEPGDEPKQVEAVSSETSQGEGGSLSLPPNFTAQRNGPLPTGNWEDSQEKLRQEWYEKLAAGVDDNDRPRRGKASLRGAAGSLRRPGASLRNTASASGSAANSQMGSLAPSRASQSPVMSPRQSGDTEGDAPSGGTLPPPPPPRKSQRGPGPGPPLPGLGPGPAPAGMAGAPGSKLKPNWAF